MMCDAFIIISIIHDVVIIVATVVAVRMVPFPNSNATAVNVSFLSYGPVNTWGSNNKDDYEPHHPLSSAIHHARGGIGFPQCFHLLIPACHFSATAAAVWAGRRRPSSPNSIPQVQGFISTSGAAAPTAAPAAAAAAATAASAAALPASLHLSSITWE